MENELIDNYLEHELHKTKDPQCSSCWTERLVVKATINRKSNEEIMEHNRRLLNPRDGSSPWDTNPLE